MPAQPQSRSCRTKLSSCAENPFSVHRMGPIWESRSSYAPCTYLIFLALLIAAACSILAINCESASAAEAPEEYKPYLQASEADMKWWRDAKFGMFVCWGPVSLTGKEIGWSRAGERRGTTGTGTTPIEVYDNLYKKWKPDKFDARKWVQVAKDAGQKYMIFLVKHHDGFCLYDTKLTDYRSTGPESAWKHDVMKDIADACHDAGLKLIVYYSQPDWYHPDYFTENHHRYIKYLHGQIRELLTNYGRIDGLWFDLGYKPEDWDSYRLFKMIRTLQPGTIINNRCGLPGDFDTPEQHIGKFQTDRPWESCITLGTQWSWKPKDKIKSLKKCIDLIARCAGGDGNLALNTNPMPNGEIEPRQVQRFREIGQWMSKYGQSIYGTRGGPFEPGAWGASTYKDNKVYLHILDWDWMQEGINFPAMDKKIIAGSLLTGRTVDVRQSDKGIAISVPKADRQKLDTIIVLELNGPAAEVQLSKLASGSVAFGKKASASSVQQDKSRQFGPQQAVDDDPATFWAAKNTATTGWLEVDLGKEITLDRAIISENMRHVYQFDLQYKDGQEWKTFYKGKRLRENVALKFKPVTARFVRLNILKCRKPPLRIEEFQLFASECVTDDQSYLQASPEDLQWWKDAKFGMFIHWGPVSLKGTEIGWSRAGERRGHKGRGKIPVEVYDNLYKQFNPTKFNAREWVKLAQDSGAKYLVFTTKHHDGFSMFDSKLTDYKITNAPFKRDVVAELAQACQEADLPLGFYYSPPDWHHPDYRTENHSRYIKYLHGQVKELCSNYGKLDIVWFDGLGGTAEDWRAETMIRMIRQLQPGVLVNNRAGLPGDFGTPEQRIGGFQTDRAWESCITLGDQWAYKPNDRIKSLKRCVQTLVRCVGNGGNLLFNMGPMPTGEFEPRQAERFREIGTWLAKYGQSIYGTRVGPFRPEPWAVSTSKGNTVYVHILSWEGQDDFGLPPIDQKIIASSVLTGGKVEVKQSKKGINIRIPAKDRQEIDTIVVLQLDAPAI